MRSERRDGTHARTVLTNMLTDREVLAAVVPHWGGGLFASRWENLAGGWAVDHYRKYKKAPGRALETYFDRWAASAKRDPDTVKTLERFLNELSQAHERNGHKLAPALVMDLAARHFTLVRGRELEETLSGALAEGDTDAVDAAVAAYRPVPIGAAAALSPLTDGEVMRRAFASRGKNLIRFDIPAADNFFEGMLEREMFVAFLAKEKGKKSFWLMRMAWAGVRSRRNVAIIETGDMSEPQFMRRLGSLIARKPWKDQKGRPVKYPTSIEPGHPPEAKYKKLQFKGAITPDQSAAAALRAGEKYGDRLRVSVHPSNTINVDGIEAILEDWSRDGFDADVIVVDYPDLLAPLDKRADKRDRINDTWMGLRRLNQKTHSLLVVATQADAASARTYTLTRDNFADDKRKYGHVTSMAAINQNPTEDGNQMFRIGWLLGRDLDFPVGRFLHTAGALSLADPMVVATC